MNSAIITWLIRAAIVFVCMELLIRKVRWFDAAIVISGTYVLISRIRENYIWLLGYVLLAVASLFLTYERKSDLPVSVIAGIVCGTVLAEWVSVGSFVIKVLVCGVICTIVWMLHQAGEK